MPQKALALINLGISPEKAAVLEQDVATAQTLVSVAPAVAAAGASLAAATVLTAIANRVNTVGAGTGVRLPSNIEVGGLCRVSNSQGTNALLVYPVTGSETINGLGAGAGFSVAAATGATFCRVSSTQWISA
jgi:hypothetical protein